ncbi:hypothetical protein QQX98_007742 [Neonectria punicea]|uniref:Uncharacterized protein n=1 Tax=Neonectria punicea TaxID=979145 RepID=A0ABR1GX04_9HYPO
MVLAVAVGQAVGPEAGAGTGFGISIVATAVAILLSKTPDTGAPRFWGKNPWLTKVWLGNQLRRDLNVVIATGKNWHISVVWPIVLRYVSALILAMVVSFAYPAFSAKSQDQLHIFAFTVAHCVMAIIGLGFIVPRWFDVFVPADKLQLSKTFYAPQVSLAPLAAHEGQEVEEQRVMEEHEVEPDREK